MTAALLVAQLLVADPALKITPSGPPLKPADAAETLRRASPDLDLSRGIFPISELPFVINVFPERRKTEPYGALGPREPLVRQLPGITYGLPHGWWGALRTESDETPRRYRSR
jgi:hypothetical protein